MDQPKVRNCRFEKVRESLHNRRREVSLLQWNSEIRHSYFFFKCIRKNLGKLNFKSCVQVINVAPSQSIAKLQKGNRKNNPGTRWETGGT